MGLLNRRTIQLLIDLRASKHEMLAKKPEHTRYSRSLGGVCNVYGTRAEIGVLLHGLTETLLNEGTPHVSTLHPAVDKLASTV